MITDIFTSCIESGPGIAVMAYLVFGYAFFNEVIADVSDKKARKASLDALKKDRKKKGRRKNFVLDRWMRFGGGFYGIAALYTYVIIEIQEVGAFIIRMLDPDNWTFDITIDLLIQLIINSVVNFIQALLWFSIWFPGKGPVGIVAWLLCGYLAYVIAGRVAQYHYVEGTGHIELWQRLDARAEKRRRKHIAKLTGEYEDKGGD